MNLYNSNEFNEIVHRLKVKCGFVIQINLKCIKFNFLVELKCFTDEENGKKRYKKKEIRKRLMKCVSLCDQEPVYNKSPLDAQMPLGPHAYELIASIQSNRAKMSWRINNNTYYCCTAKELVIYLPIAICNEKWQGTLWLT